MFSILANTAVTIFRVSVFWGGRKLYIDQVVGGNWVVKGAIGGTEEGAIQSGESMSLRKRDDEKTFGDQVVRKKVMEKVFALKWFGKEVFFLFLSLSLHDMKTGKKESDEREVE
jgi:hypothetical protein